VAQIVTYAHRHIAWHACTDLLMHTHRSPKTRSVWPSLFSWNRRRNKVGINTCRHFQASWASQLLWKCHWVWGWCSYIDCFYRFTV